MGLTYSSVIDADRDEVFSWHTRPGAITRLIPPWQPVRVLREAGSLRDGRATLSLPGGLRWVAAHRPDGYDPPNAFTDELTSLPLPWRHTHQFSPAGEGTTLVTDVQYAGQRGLPGLAAGLPRGRGRYVRMLAEVPRFHRAARRLLDHGDHDGQVLADFLRTGGFSRYFTAHFALPLVAAVWSCPPATRTTSATSACGGDCSPSAPAPGANSRPWTARC
jgi:ligand-binding SRPBCC domain-containing protein